MDLGFVETSLQLDNQLNCTPISITLILNALYRSDTCTPTYIYEPDKHTHAYTHTQADTQGYKAVNFNYLV